MENRWPKNARFHKKQTRRIDLKGQAELYAILAQISLPWQQGSAHNILYGSIELAIPENPVVGANISVLSALQAEL